MFGLILAAVAQVASPVKVDGVLNEAVWKSAEWRDDFKRLATQASMGPLTRKTAFAIVSDAHTLYLGVRCEEPNVERLKGGKDIDIWIGDSVEFFFAPTGSHFDYYHFGVSPVSSTLFATFHSEGGAITPDPFAPSWTRACAFGEKEWTAEVAIPLSAFYMTRNADWQTTWLFDMTRTFRQPSEYASWSQMEVKFGEPRRFSRLAGFPKRSDADDFRAWSVIPEVTGRSETGIETRLDLEVYTAVAGEYEATLSEGVAPTRLNLAKGVNRVSLAAVYPDNGRYKTRFTFRRLADGATFERRHTVTIDYQPIRIRLTTPQYRNNFYPGQKVEKVEGAATVLEKGLAEVTLEGPGFARQTVRVASGEKFAFDVRGFELGDATLTVKTAANEKTVKVRNLPPTKAQMVWIEDGHLVVNGKPVLRRNLYAEFYKGGEKLDAKYRREIDSFHTTPAFARYLDIQPDRVIAGLERKEAVKDVKPCAAYFAAVDRMIEANRDTDFGYYYVIDEPECRGISQVYLQHIYDYVSEKDPYHPILTASRGGKRYLSCVDWVETHPYLSPRNMKDGRRYGRHPNEMGDFLDAFGCWDRGDKAVGFLPTCFAYRWQTTVEDYPTFDEYVLHYWAAMMRGGKSLWPYAYHDVGDRPALWDGTKYMFACFEALEDLVILGRRTGCRKDKDAEIVRYDLADDALLVAVNFRKEEQTVTLPSFAGTLREFRGTRTFAGGADVPLRPFEALILTRKPHDAGLEPFASVRARIQAAEAERTHRDNQLLERYDDITYESNFNGGHGSGFYKLVDGMYDQLAKGSSEKPDRYWQLNFRNGLKPRFDRLVVHGSGTFDEVETSVFADGAWTKLPVVRREKTDKYRVVISFDRPYVAEKVRFDFAGRKGSRNAFELYEIELPRIASGIHLSFGMRGRMFGTGKGDR